MLLRSGGFIRTGPQNNHYINHRIRSKALFCLENTFLLCSRPTLAKSLSWRGMTSKLAVKPAASHMATKCQFDLKTSRWQRPDSRSELKPSCFKMPFYLFFSTFARRDDDAAKVGPALGAHSSRRTAPANV